MTSLPPPTADQPTLPPLPATDLVPAPPSAVIPSPRWGVLTKFLVALVLLVLLGAVLVRFQEMIAPLVLAVILAYLLKPVVAALTARTRLSWSAAAAVVYVSLLIIIVTLLTVAGIALVQQVQGLYGAVADIAADPVTRLQAILSKPFTLGPFAFDFSQPFTIGPFGPFQVPDLTSGAWQPIIEQALAAIQPALQRTGVLVGNLATSTASTLGWVLFILVVSYYLLNDVRNIGVSIERLVPEEYAYDVRRLVNELGPIWNAFLRGQITLGITMGVLIGVTMAILGVKYAVVLGLLGGLLEFIPVIGPVIAGGTALIIALFQPSNWLGLNPITFALVVLGASILLQQIENNFLVPRILGGSLNLHAVVILVGAVIAASLAGIIGLLLSAPMLATLRLFGRYIYCKLFDLDPWPDPPAISRPPTERKWARWARQRLSGLFTRQQP